MSKLVFKPGEIRQMNIPKQIELPAKYQKNLIETEDFKEFEVDEEGNPIDVYQGPSIEEMEAELERYRRETEEEVKEMLEQARERAKQIEEEGKAGRLPGAPEGQGADKAGDGAPPGRVRAGDRAGQVRS